ncbi:MAG TPA: cytochrome c [Terriglobales bacterium]|nr:cytochrome c [Terriglobales bacterium]
MRKMAVILALTVAVLMLAPAALADDAAALYKSKCASCHGADGKASAIGKKMGAKDLQDPELKKATEAEWIDITTKGKAKMPAYDKKLTADQIKALVAYMKELSKK